MPDSSAVKKLKINEEDKTPRFKNNPYQYTRGIRFRLNIQRESKQFQEKYSFKNQKNIAVKTANFNQKNNQAGEGKLDNKIIEKLLEFHKELSSLIFFKGKKPSSQTKSSNNLAGSTESDKKSQFRAKLSINKTWLKNWYSNSFHTEIKTVKNAQGKYALKGLTQIHFDFQERLENWEKYREQIKKAVSSSQHSQVRHSDISESIKALLNRRQWDYWNEFLTELHTKTTEEDSKVKNLKKKLEDIRKELKTAEKHYLSSQSEGVEIAKASFNYYTLNKKPKEYYTNKLQKLKDGKNKDIFSKITPTKDSGYFWKYYSNKKDINNQKNLYKNKKNEGVIFQFKTEQEKKWIERYIEINKNSDQFTGNLKEDTRLSINQSYHLMKAFKADQKSIFYELMSHVATNQNKSYKVNIKNSPLKGYEISYEKLNFENINKMFSLFEFQEKKSLNKKSSIDKILDLYKNRENKVTADKVYQVFIDLTKNIQGNKKSSENYKQKRQQHPKHRFLASRNNRFRNRENIEDTSYKNKNILGEGKKAKQNRGAFLFGKFCCFKKYGSFCEEYKKIAQKRGRLKAQIKGIEREKQESAQTHFWSLVYCEKDKKQLWLIPRTVSKENKLKENQNSNDKIQAKNTSSLTNLREAKKEIDRLEEASSEKEISLKQETGCLYYIKSLTKRALHKLCFAEESSFVREMPDNLKQLQKKAKEIKTKDEDESQQKEKLEEKNQKQLDFFKELLKDYAKEKLNLKSFDLSQIDEAQDMPSFEKTLEEQCYKEKKLIFKDNHEKEKFIKNFDVTVLHISSYDLEGRNKNTFQTPESANRFHTDLWKVFWKSAERPNEYQKVKDFELGKVRLNPEVKIRYRKANENLKDYFKKRKFPDKFKHRLLQDQLSAHFTLSLNAGTRYEDLAFAKTEELIGKINDFNKKLNKQMNFKTAWKYGIDRGQKELATLCLAQFDPDKEIYKVGDKKIVRPRFPITGEKIECYTLKDYHYSKDKIYKEKIKKQYIVKNPSYFIDKGSINEKLFKKESISCLDLTIAKVIKGKVITNGDVLTYLKLKKESAKRKLFNIYSSDEIKNESNLKWSEWENGQKDDQERNRPEAVLNIETSKGEKTIYYYDKRFTDILIDEKRSKDNLIKESIRYNQDTIKQCLDFYLQKLKNNDNSHTPSISKINHLRDAITANMVGIICHLQKEYPGFVILEDLKEETIDRHFLDNNENISRRLENALYNKFQTLGLVPPHVKNIIQLRESIRGQQKSKEEIEKECKSLKQGIKKMKSGLSHCDASKKEDLEKKINEEEKKLSSRENKISTKSSQIGTIIFVDEEKTSKTCPYCEEALNSKQNEKEINEQKFKQKRFLCNHSSCGFDTYFFKSEEERVKGYTPQVKEELNKKEFKILKDINDPDKAAAYNIAKKITDPEKIGKMK